MDLISFHSRHVAERLGPPPESVLISIYDRSEPRLVPQPGWTDVLYLRFHDSDGSHLGLEQFSLDQAQQALDFVHRHLGAYQLVIHCQMGRSRSAALALFFSDLLGVRCYNGTAPVDPKYNQQNHRVVRLLREALDGEGGAALRAACGA